MPRFALAAAVSLGCHGIVLLGLPWLGPSLDLEVEFTLPETVEFGLSVESQAFPNAAAEMPESDLNPKNSAPEGGAAVDTAEEIRSRQEAEKAARAAAREKRRERLAAARRLAAQRRAQQQEQGSAESGGTLPPGAQLALRINLEAVVGTALEQDVRTFLARVPDWQLVLDGSGIDPVRDLSRVLVASPNLRRSRVVIAGAHRHDVGWSRATVARLADSSGDTAPWSSFGPFPMAPWRNRDHTERVAVLLGPRSFLIARPEDVPRVLASALASATGPEDVDPLSDNRPSQDSAGRDSAGQDSAQTSRNADATSVPEAQSLVEGLLWMPEGAALSVTAEGAKNYARGAHIPDRASLQVRPRSDGNLDVIVQFSFDDAAATTEAEAHYRRLLDRAGQNMWLAMSGMTSLVHRAQLVREGTALRATTISGPRQARMVLATIGATMEDYARSRGDHPGRTPRPLPSRPETPGNDHRNNANTDPAAASPTNPNTPTSQAAGLTSPTPARPTPPGESSPAAEPAP